MLDDAKEHYHFELTRRSEINANLKTNIQLALTGIGFLYFVGTRAEVDIAFFGIFYWGSFSIFIISIITSGFASLYYATRFPDSPDVVKKYHETLKNYDESKADELLQKFLVERWIDNASVNADRNRGRSLLNLISRISIVIASFPLLLVAVLSVKVPFIP